MSTENEKLYWDSENPWGHESVANCLAHGNVEVICRRQVADAGNRPETLCPGFICQG